MKTREEALTYGLSFPDTYQDAPFRDANWQLVRVKKSKKNTHGLCCDAQTVGNFQSYFMWLIHLSVSCMTAMFKIYQNRRGMSSYILGKR